MNYHDYNYKTKILKISSAVINGLNSGRDPFQEILKEAQNEELTPNFVKAAVQHINNEIFLNHYTRGGDGKVQVIDPDKVIEALNIEVTEKTASATPNQYVDYWDLKKKPAMTKTAREPYVDATTSNRLNSIRSINDMKKKAEARTLEFSTYSKIVKTASEIQEVKKKLYEDTLLSLKRGDVEPEEIDFLHKTAADGDVKESLQLAIKRSGTKPKYDLMKNASLFDENEVNTDSSILQKIHVILEKKADLNNLVTKYKELT